MGFQSWLCPTLTEQEMVSRQIDKDLKKYPNSAILFNMLGVAYAQSKETKNAEKNFRKAIEADTNYAQAYNNLGTLLYELKKINPSFKVYGIDISKYAIKNSKKEDGFVKVFLDENLVMNYSGVTFDWKGQYKHSDIRIGIYRDSDPNGSGYPDQSIHFDDFTVVHVADVKAAFIATWEDDT